MNDFLPLTIFENLLSDFFGSTYAVAVDSCTHALELSLLVTNSDLIICPKNTYISVPMMLRNARFNFKFEDVHWEGYYRLTSRVLDCAVLWSKNSYIPGTLMCLSFHHRKHLNLGRGGMILLDDPVLYKKLIKLRYDNRNIYDGVLYNQDFDIDEPGYHYYMTPEEAVRGIQVFKEKRDTPSKKVSYLDYPDLTQYKLFNRGMT